MALDPSPEPPSPTERHTESHIRCDGGEPSDDDTDDDTSDESHSPDTDAAPTTAPQSRPNDPQATPDLDSGDPFTLQVAPDTILEPGDLVAHIRYGPLYVSDIRTGRNGQSVYFVPPQDPPEEADTAPTDASQASADDADATPREVPPPATDASPLIHDGQLVTTYWGRTFADSLEALPKSVTDSDNIRSTDGRIEISFTITAPEHVTPTISSYLSNHLSLLTSSLNTLTPLDRMNSGGVDWDGLFTDIEDQIEQTRVGGPYQPPGAEDGDADDSTPDDEADEAEADGGVNAPSRSQGPAPGATGSSGDDTPEEDDLDDDTPF